MLTGLILSDFHDIEMRGIAMRSLSEVHAAGNVIVSAPIERKLKDM